MSQKLFLTSTIVAAVVATSVVPTTALAAKATDINKLHPTDKAFVEKSIELGYFLDRPTFNPDQPITRGQAAKTLAREVTGGKTIADYKAFVEKEQLEKKVKPFKDVPSSYKTGNASQQELYYVSLIVKHAGAFTQDQLLPNANTKRSQMAKMVVEIFNLEDTGKAVTITDLNLIHEKDQKYVKIAAQHGLTTVSKFNPYGELKRSQMAKFLVQAHDAKTGEEKPEISIDKVIVPTQTIDLKSFVTFKLNDDKKEITAADLPEGYTAKFKASQKVFAGATEPSLTSTTGQIHSKVEANTTFDVEVDILNKEGKVVAQSKVAKVTVLDYSQVVESIERLELSMNGQPVQLDEIALRDELDVRLFAKVKGQKEMKEITAFDLSVNQPAVLSIKGKNQLQAKAKGNAEITVSIGDLKRIYKVKVKDERRVDANNSSIDRKEVKIAKEKSQTFHVTLKDQYGVAKPIHIANLKVEPNVATLLARPAEVKQGKEVGQYIITLPASKVEQKGNVTVYADNVEIGKVDVDVRQASQEIHSYQATVENAVFDKKKNGNAKQKVELKAFDVDGLEVAQQPILDGEQIKLVSKDEKVAKVNKDTVELAKTAKAGDTVIVEIIETKGAIVKKLGDLKFHVVDTTPSITEVTFTSEPAITEETKSFDLTSVMNVIAKVGGTDETVPVTYVDGESVKKGKVTVQMASVATDAPYVFGEVVITFNDQSLVDNGPIQLEVKDGKIYVKAIPQKEEVTGTLKIAVIQNDTFIEKGGTFPVKIQSK